MTRRATPYVSCWWDGRALYIQGANAVIKVGKRDLVRLANTAVMPTMYMVIKKDWRRYRRPREVVRRLTRAKEGRRQ